MHRLFIFMAVVFFMNAYDAGTHVFGALPVTPAMEKSGAMDCCPHKTTQEKSATTACHYCCSGLLERAIVLGVHDMGPWAMYSPGLQAGVKEGEQAQLFRPPRDFQIGTRI